MKTQESIEPVPRLLVEERSIQSFPLRVGVIQRLDALWKNSLASILVFTFFVLSAASAQPIQPNLNIIKSGQSTMIVYWNSVPGVIYNLLCTDQIDPFAQWYYIGAWQAEDDFLGVEFENDVFFPFMTFFKVCEENQETGRPAVRIHSPAMGQTKSGLLTIALGAGDDSRLSSVSLYMDDVLIGTRTSGDLNFTIDTSHYPNGAHTFIAVALDNVGIPELGGDPNCPVTSNIGLSDPVTVHFQNSLRWLDADSLFSWFVPITAETDVYPTDWTVFVEDRSGTVVRMWIGYTTSNTIQTQWDGLDNNGNPVPENAAYRVTLALGTPPSPHGPPGNGGDSSPPPQPMTVSVNSYGVPEYELIEDSTQIDAEKNYTLDNNEKNNGDLPPLPPGFKLGLKADKYKAKKKLSVREVTLASSTSSGISSSTVIWKEQNWSSSQIFLARQKVTSNYTIDAQRINNVRNINIWIEGATDTLGLSRGVYNSSPLEIKTAGDWHTALTILQRDDVRDFYYLGHCTGTSIGFSQTTPSDGLQERTVAKTLLNLFKPATSNDPRLIFHIMKPFRFVFLDGCASATGLWPEAFGIVSLNYQATNKKTRAFLGWKTTVKDSFFSANYINFSRYFWQEWVGNENYEIQLQQARVAAHNRAGIPLEESAVYGYKQLTWAD